MTNNQNINITIIVLISIGAVVLIGAILWTRVIKKILGFILIKQVLQSTIKNKK